MKIFLPDGRMNRCGERVREERLRLGLTQEEMAARLQVAGLPLTQLAISRIEIGKRIVPDCELPYLA